MTPSFLEQVGSEESSWPPPADVTSGGSDASVPAVRHANITDLINESYEVRSTQAGAAARSLCCCLFSSVLSRQKFGDLTVRHIERLRCRHRIQVLQAHEDTTKENTVSP